MNIAGRRTGVAKVGKIVKQTSRAIERKMDWYNAFIKRFPDLFIQKPKQKEMSRKRSTTDVSVKSCFQELHKILTKFNMKNKPEQKLNVNEIVKTLYNK